MILALFLKESSYILPLLKKISFISLWDRGFIDRLKYFGIRLGYFDTKGDFQVNITKHLSANDVQS